MTETTSEGSAAAEPTRDGAESRRFVARIRVMPRPEILDPQGKAIGSALGRLGFDQVEEVRAGKSFELVIRVADRETAERQLARMGAELLANPIIEDYRLDALEELEELDRGGAR